MSKKENNHKQLRSKIDEEDVKQYVIDRFKDIKKSKKIKDLVKFQTMNKYMIMVHDQEELKIMGKLVASHKKKELSEIIKEYEMHLKLALKSNPTVKKHINVLIHIFGYFLKNLNQYEKEKCFEMLKEFREEKTELGEILAEMNPIIFRFDKTYLANQTYFLLYSTLQHELSYNLLNIKISKI